MDKKNIFIITHINFWERALGSHQRLFSLVSYLKKYFNIKVLYILKEKSDDKEKLLKFDLQNNVVFIDECYQQTVDEIEINSFLEKYSILKTFFVQSLYAKMSNYIENKQLKPDAVIIEYIHLSYFLPIFKNTLKILDTHDIMNIRNKLFKKNNKKHWIDISEKEEFNIFNIYNKILTIQEKEYKYLIQNNIDSIFVPYPINIVRRLVKKQVQNIIFIGGYNEANVNAIKWFINNIWKYFDDLGLKLFIYGTVSNALSNIRHKNIYLEGKVENLDEVYQEADIAINPVKIGGGLKIKNIEAMANSIPLITTNEGANGLKREINNSFLLANTSKEWIEAILYLMISKDLRLLLVNNAIEFIENNFSESSAYTGLVKYIKG